MVPPAEGTVVVALFAGDNARMGDVFSNSVGPRAEAAIRGYLYDEHREWGRAR